jgi:hypothetical protein
MAIEALALYAATDPASAQELGELLDAWQSAVPELLDHEQITALVAELQDVGADTAARALVKALVPLGLRRLVEDPGSSQDGRSSSAYASRWRRMASSKTSRSPASASALGPRVA